MLLWGGVNTFGSSSSNHVWSEIGPKRGDVGKACLSSVLGCPLLIHFGVSLLSGPSQSPSPLTKACFPM